MANGFETLERGGQAAAMASGNPLAIGASFLVPFLLKQAGIVNQSDRDRFGRVTEAQAQNQLQLSQNLGAQLRGEETPALRAILSRLEGAQKEQRLATEESLSRNISGAGVGGGATFRASIQQRQDEAFNRAMTELLGQFNLGAQQIVAGQTSTVAGSQFRQTALESDEIQAFDQGISAIIAEADKGDRFSQRVTNLLDSIFRSEKIIESEALPAAQFGTGV